MNNVICANRTSLYVLWVIELNFRDLNHDLRSLNNKSLKNHQIMSKEYKISLVWLYRIFKHINESIINLIIKQI
jgi:hypothetical protein